MARPPSRYPTELESEILKIIWKDGKGTTVRTVRDGLAATAERNLAYNTVLTMMTIMTRKNYLKRKMDKTGLFHTYTAKLNQAATRKAMLMDVVERMYDGNTAEATKDLRN